MIYKAKVPFDYQDINGAVIKARAGDCIPNFELWPYVCQQAHLRLDWIEKVEEEKPLEQEPPQEETKPKKGRSSKK
jgi:hypothetical protein